MLAARFKDHQPDISAFLEYCRQIPPKEASLSLSSLEVAARLGRLDSVGLRILAELLDEVRIQGEADQLYHEAAYWDLIADRVKDELASRT